MVVQAVGNNMSLLKMSSDFVYDRGLIAKDSLSQDIPEIFSTLAAIPPLCHHW